MGSDEMIVFEESNYDDLVKKFIEKNLSVGEYFKEGQEEKFLDANRDAFEDFVEEEYQVHCADMIDYAKTRGNDI